MTHWKIEIETPRGEQQRHSDQFASPEEALAAMPCLDAGDQAFVVEWVDGGDTATNTGRAFRVVDGTLVAL